MVVRPSLNRMYKDNFSTFLFQLHLLARQEDEHNRCTTGWQAGLLVGCGDSIWTSRRSRSKRRSSFIILITLIIVVTSSQLYHVRSVSSSSQGWLSKGNDQKRKSRRCRRKSGNKEKFLFAYYCLGYLDDHRVALLWHEFCQNRVGDGQVKVKDGILFLHTKATRFVSSPPLVP